MLHFLNYPSIFTSFSWGHFIRSQSMYILTSPTLLYYAHQFHNLRFAKKKDHCAVVRPLHTLYANIIDQILIDIINRDTNGGGSNAKMSNGYPEANNSPNSSQISADGSAGHHSNDGGPTLISRTQKQHTTQQV